MLVFAITFLILGTLGMTIAFALGASALVALWVENSTPMILGPQRIFVLLNSFTIMAIPFFMLAGELMNTGGVTRRLLNFADALVGHIKGGLAQVNVLQSMLFAGISGSSAADASAEGAIIIPAMIEKGYNKHFTVAVTCCTAVIGPIIPPSIIMIIYASLTGLSVGELFAAGIVPGILLGLFQMIVCYIAAGRGYCGTPRPRATLRELWTSFKGASLPLLMPAIVLGGILTGVFTATEAGVVAAVVALILGVFVFKETKIKDLKKVFYAATVRSAQCMLIAAFAAIAAWLLAKEQFGPLATTFLMRISKNPMVLFLLMELLVLITGCFVDTMATCLILIPILAPIASQLGIDSLQFATVTVICIVLGGITPPVAPLLYIASSIAGTKPMEDMRAVLPFLLAAVVLVVVLVFVPPLTTFLPRLLFH